MANLRVNTIVNKADNGAVELTQGATIPAGQTIEGDLEINSSGIITSTSLQVNGGMNLSGVATATTFYGAGVNLTNVSGTANGKGIAFAVLI